MNLIKELKPYNDLLDQWKSGIAIRKPEEIEALADIWWEFAKENVVAVYGYANHKVPRTLTNCSSCIGDMFDFLYNWRAIELRNPDNGVYHKFPASKKGTTTIKPKADPKNKTNLSKLSWNDLKALAKENNIKVHGKKRLILEAEIEKL